MSPWIRLFDCSDCGGPAGELIDEDGMQWARCRPCGKEYTPATIWNTRNLAAKAQPDQQSNLEA